MERGNCALAEDPDDIAETTAVDPSRVGDAVAHLSGDELGDIDRALRVVLGLDG